MKLSHNYEQPKNISGRLAELKERIKCFGLKRAILYFIFQRILRVNSQIPWPVHWSSEVICWKQIKRKCWRPYPGYSIGSYIQAVNGIEIGINVRFGPGVKIISADHDSNDYSRHIKTGPIKIGDNVWLCSNSVLLPGVEIADHTIVAAGAVVTKSFTQGNCILAGVPAVVIKQLPDYQGKVTG